MPPPNRPSPKRTPSAEFLARKEFDGTIRLVTFENEDGTFKIVTFVPEDGPEFKASGNLYGAVAGETLRIRGDWFEHAKHGWTFRIESFLVRTPTTEDGLVAYLGSGLIKGIGPRTAQRIVERFGETTLKVLDETPELLTGIKGITNDKAREIVKAWEQHRAAREAMIFLKEHGLTTAMALRLVRHYGDNVVAVLRENPYRVGLEVPMIGFTKADEIATGMGVARESPMRLQAALVHVLENASFEGHTHLLEEELLEKAIKLLGVPPAAIAEALSQVVARQYIRRVEGLADTPAYFMPSLFYCESGCVDFIGELIRQARPLITEGIDRRIDDFQSRYKFKLAPQQADAIRSAMAGGVCVITGGPGTGKTTLVRALLHLIGDKETNVRYALCSPTGRAAQRLAETTRQEAATVHRLLRWNPQGGKFTHDENNRLPVDLLIVDESSMLDIPLAFSLLRAVPPGATVIFVGDVDQLPSVGPGTFLRDLIESERVRVQRLKVIFRQDDKSYIIKNSHRINEGHGIQLATAGADSDFHMIEREAPEEVQAAVVTMATERIPRKLGVDALDDVQVLTPMRRGPLGTAELNLALQRALNPGGAVILPHLPFRLGDKVIQTSNNYDLDVYNGDVGRIEGIHPDTQEIQVRFGKRTVFYPAENLSELELAYAITIHKSQGSEYSAVLVVLHTSHFVMLKRNLLYTAVTRGKKMVVLVGNRKALNQAIRTSTESERRTALGQWLQRPPDKGELLR